MRWSSLGIKISEQRNVTENNELYPKRRPGVESAEAPSSGFFMFLLCYNTVCCDHMLQRPRCGGVDGEMMTGPLSSQHSRSATHHRQGVTIHAANVGPLPPGNLQTQNIAHLQCTVRE